MRTNYYANLAADYSRAGLVPEAMKTTLIDDAARFIVLKELALPASDVSYSREQIEDENREWWPTHCEALRQGRGDLLSAPGACRWVWSSRPPTFRSRPR
jgi:hypothetical protein